MRVPFTLSENNITVFAGGKMHTVLAGHKNFDTLRDHLRSDEHDVDLITQLADRAHAIQTSKAGRTGKVSVEGGVVYYEGQEVHGALTDKLLGLLDEGFNVDPWIHFLENLMENPSFRSRKCLYEFLEHFNAPITPDGCFIAFKRVGYDWKDLHSKTFDNSIGTVVKMDRTKVDDDPQHTCSHGLHVCADEYLKGYATGGNTRTLVVEVNPRDVVAVPYDYNFSKMRVCEYKVLSEIAVEDIPTILSSETYGDWDYDDYERDFDVDGGFYDC